MKTLTVALPGREYDILIQRGLLDQAGAYCRKSLPRAGRLFVVTDSNVAPLYAFRLEQSLTAAGFPQAQAEAYLRRAGDTEITRTHGRREVAFLNRAWEDVLALDLCLDVTSQAQPLLDHAVNTLPSRCVGFEGLGMGLERLAAIWRE